MTNEERRKKREYMKLWLAKHPGYYHRANMSPSQLERAKAKGRVAHARFRARNPEKHRVWSSRYAKRNPQKIKNRTRKLRESGAFRSSDYRNQRREYRHKNRERIRAYHRAYMKRWIEKDENHQIQMRLRWRLQGALRRDKAKKSANTMTLLGCDIEFFKWYMADRFTDGMTWKNHGKWHIDHIIPCAEFDLRDPEQQRKCFHYSNLQPLWGKDNLSKGARRPVTHQSEMI